jgi:UDP-N-acetyl-2-amino-2-deoxyglucuronate dehydrogenase
MFEDANKDDIKKLRYGLIGCGRISKKHLEALYSNKTKFLPVAFCDLKSELSNKAAEEVNDEFSDNKVKSYTSYEKMLKENELDVVAVATESGNHAEITIKALESGINVICEKPMALSIEDADKIIACSKKTGKKVAVCLQNRFNVPIQKLKTAIDKNRFGKIFHGQISIRWNRNASYYDQAEWRGTWDRDGGALLNQCSHGIDLIQWLMGGEIRSVYGMIRNFNRLREAEDFGAAILEFKGGQVGIIEGAVDVYPKNLEEKVSIFGEKGTVVIGGVAVNTIETWRFEDEDIVEDRIDPPNVYGFGHVQLYNDLYDAIINNKKPYISAEDAKKSVEIILGMYKSALENRKIEFPFDFKTTEMKGIFDGKK